MKTNCVSRNYLSMSFFVNIFAQYEILKFAEETLTNS